MNTYLMPEMHKLRLMSVDLAVITAGSHDLFEKSLSFAIWLVAMTCLVSSWALESGREACW